MNEELSFIWKNKALIFLQDLYNILRDPANDFNRANKDNNFVKNCIMEYIVEVLKMTDSIIILIREGRIDTALILTRALFEVTLQLCYLINDKKTIEEKAAFYLVVNNLKRYHYNKTLMKNLKLLDIDRDLSKGIRENKDIIDSLEKNNIFVIKETFGYIKNNYGDIDNIIWKNEKWFKFFAKKSGQTITNFRILSEKIGFYDTSKDKKVLIYDSLYDLLSQHAHGISALDNIVFVDNKQKFRNFDCLQHGQLVLKVTYVLFDKIIQDMAKIYYEEFKISSHMIRMEKIYLNDLKSDYQKMYEDI